MADTERLINKEQGDSIISAIQGITARLQEMYTVDDAMSSSSENPVQNKVITAALDNKVDKVEGKGLSTNDYTNEEKASVANSAEQLESTQTASGNPLTLTDAAPINAESLVVELEPKQDLHGQSAPYVGGVRKNKCPIDLQNGNTGTGMSWTIKTDADGNKIGIVLNGTHVGSSRYFATVASIYLESGNYYLSGAYNDNAALELIGDGVDIYNNNAENPTAFTISTNGTYTLYIAINTNAALSNAELKPMIRLSTETDSTFAPYSNICPITGYTECEVDDVGKNKVDISETTISSSDYVFNLTNLNIQQGTYTFSFDCTEDGNASFACGDDNTDFVNDYILVRGGKGAITFISTNTITQMRLYGYAATYSNIQLEEGTTATTYEPYHSSNATIQFGQTIFGGSVDFLTGVLTVDRVSVDLGALSYGKYDNEGNIRFQAELQNCKTPGNNYGIANIDCSHYKKESWNTVVSASGNGCICINGTVGVAAIQDKRYDSSTVSDFKTAMSGVQLAYELAEPFTIQLTPTELKLLLQYNNLTTNGTTIALGYQPDNVIGEVKVEIQEIKEMPYLRILDNDVDTEIKNYRLYYRLISSAYTLVNLAEMLQHRFLFVEVIQNPSGTANHKLLHSALIDPRTIDGFEYQMKAGTGDTVIIESNIAENKFDLSVQYTGTHTSGDPTDYYVTIRMVD